MLLGYPEHFRSEDYVAIFVLITKEEGGKEGGGR